MHWRCENVEVGGAISLRNPCPGVGLAGANVSEHRGGQRRSQCGQCLELLVLDV